MCRQVKCDKCGKPSWAGCGLHVEHVLGHIPKADRCACRETAASGGGGLGSSMRKLFGG